MAKGIRGQAIYSVRAPDLPDVAMYDDSVDLEFDPLRHDYQALLNEEALRLATGIHAYRLQVGPIRDSQEEHELWSSVDMRHGIHRFDQFNFFQAHFWSHATGTSVSEAVARLKDVVERVELHAEGIVLVLTSALDPEAEDAVNMRVAPGAWNVNRCCRPN